MAKHLRYYGEFATVEGHSVRVAIYQESDTAFTPEEVRFPADSPLVIEWGEVEKYDVICGSTATLKIISPSDRKLIDMYTVRYGLLRLDVWRDGRLYWTGCIDPEFYEEPYERLDNYEVSLTFSDFSNLSRIPFDVEPGFFSIREILTRAILQTQCVRLSVSSDFDESFEYSKDKEREVDWDSFKLSTTDKNDNEIVKSGYVRADNFYDKDGKAKSWADVIEGILQPLNVRLTQKNGMLYLYDLHGISSSTTESIYWSSDSQTLSADKVYNNIKITWSPNADGLELYESGIWLDSIEVNREDISLYDLDGKTIGSSTIFSYPLYAPSISSKDTIITPGFTLWTNSNYKNVELSTGYRAFKLVPQYDGQECEGVAVYWRSIRPYWYAKNGKYYLKVLYKEHGVNPISLYKTSISRVILKTPKKLLNPQSEETPVQMKIRMEMLVDCRINPFEDPFYGFSYSSNLTVKCDMAMRVWKLSANFFYIPVKVCFRPRGTEDVYVYTNKNIFTHDNKSQNFDDTVGYWTRDDNQSFCYLAYYSTDQKERLTSTELCKWVMNKHAINNTPYSLSTMVKNLEDGQYVTYPDEGGQGGEIWLEVMGDGWVPIKTGYTSLDEKNQEISASVRMLMSFALIKEPQLDILNNNVFDTEVDDSDVVYEAECNPDAREELEIDTVCGTYEDGIPTARGAYYTESGQQITKMKRAGVTAAAEELLCGTLFSQYADRHVALSGESRLEEERGIVCKEDNQEGRVFLRISDAINLIKDTSDAKIVELTQDTYIKR